MVNLDSCKKRAPKHKWFKSNGELGIGTWKLCSATLNPLAVAWACPSTSGNRKTNFCEKCGHQVPDAFVGCLPKSFLLLPLSTEDVNVNVICLPTKHQRVHKNSFRNVRAFQDQIGIWKCWFLRRGKTGVPGEKPLGAEKRTNNKLNPHMMPGPGNRTRDTLVEGEHSHHCASPAPLRWGCTSNIFFIYAVC